jgi:hypothetical protein
MKNILVVNILFIFILLDYLIIKIIKKYFIIILLDYLIIKIIKKYFIIIKLYINKNNISSLISNSNPQIYFMNMNNQGIQNFILTLILIQFVLVIITFTIKNKVKKQGDQDSIKISNRFLFVILFYFFITVALYYFLTVNKINIVLIGLLGSLILNFALAIHYFRRLKKQNNKQAIKVARSFFTIYLISLLSPVVLMLLSGGIILIYSFLKKWEKNK